MWTCRIPIYVHIIHILYIYVLLGVKQLAVLRGVKHVIGGRRVMRLKLNFHISKKKVHLKIEIFPTPKLFIVVLEHYHWGCKTPQIAILDSHKPKLGLPKWLLLKNFSKLNQLVRLYRNYCSMYIKLK